jgi:hypothetical protein
MKGLLIAYSFYPEKTVGALRPTYWADEISKHAAIELDVITATPCERPNVSVVPLTSNSIFSAIIKDEGLRWKKDVLKFLNTCNLEHYSFAILTGGPFFHFWAISRYLKKKGIKVILDFRDPFSYNPRFNEKGLKKWIKQNYEKQAVKCADLIVTVNKECHQYIAPNLKVKRAVIPNGYDERALPPSNPTSLQPNSLFYAGRLYWNPADFLDVLTKNKWNLYHAGQVSQFKHPFFESEHYHYLGLITQKELYEQLQHFEIGVVFTMNIPFESTTKIYDYIGLNKKILVVTQGKPEEGALKRELATYPNYRWVENDKNAIEQAIIELMENPVQAFEASIYSRKKALEQLVQEIHNL